MLVQPFRWLAWFVVRFVMSGRYRVRVVGQDEVFRKPGPYLVLPNHPGYCDPPNIIVKLWPAFRFRPMLLETLFQNPILGPFSFLLRAIKIPDVDKASAEARRRAGDAVAEAIEALRAGDNVALWPSGRIMRDGVERVGGTRAVADILAAVPDVTVVLVRSRGFWGSMFSWAQTSKKMNLPLLWIRGLGIFFANLLVFAPRRPVTMTLEAFTKGERPPATREAINPWLEGWYNADVKPEPPTYVPYHFLFGPRTFDFPPPPTAAAIDVSQVKPETKRAIAEVLGERLKRPVAESELQSDTALLELGLDSLDVMEVTLEVEQRFGFQGDVMPATVGQLWALAEGVVDKTPPKPPPPAWFAPSTGSHAIEVLGETVPAAILNRVLRNPTDMAMIDEISGAVTYQEMLIRALTLAKRYREIPEPNVGLLFPASVAGVVSLVALHLAGKLPVILNWTTGPGNLEHAVKLLGVRTVITSKAFVDRAHIVVPGVEFFYLEELRKTVRTTEFLVRSLMVRLFRGPIVRRLRARLDADPDKPCVVLFTSGSEKAPKAVPLTHANVIADMVGTAPQLNVSRADSVLVFLPLFHSFGHTVTGLFPLFAGVRAVYHPDPTDAGALVRKATAYKPTIVASTPTFLGYMLDRAKPGELDSVRLAVVGAERCPDTVFAKAKELLPHAPLLEGYGITECSPVVSVNPSHDPRPGTIGPPILGVEVCVVDLESDEVLPPGRLGMLLVTGPTIFPGYIGFDGPQPFREIDGKRWYITGDLAEVGADGYVRFHGRLKRFLKAAGEMISLPALEEPFAQRYPPTEAGPRVAVEGVETPGGRRIVLFTTEDLTLRDANALLVQNGYRGIMRLDEVRRLDAIPVLGSGKTDYKVLRGMIASAEAA
jgi:long-chain-fatty-acid--[acyl-carrier-protein] ligase